MKTLLVIDMQEAYFKDQVLIAQKDRLINNIGRLITDFQSDQQLIINARTAHARDKSTWTRNMLEDDKGFAFEHEDETRTVAGLCTADTIDITKDRDSCFHDTQLLSILKNHHVSEITLAGILAHTCVFHTAVDAYAHNFRVILARNAIGDTSDQLQQQAFQYLVTEYRQTII